MNAHETVQKITSDHFVRKTIVYLRQSSLQQGKLPTSSMAEAQPHLVQIHAATQVHIREPQGNSSQLINAGQARTKTLGTDCTRHLCTLSTTTRRKR